MGVGVGVGVGVVVVPRGSSGNSGNSGSRGSRGSSGSSSSSSSSSSWQNKPELRSGFELKHVKAANVLRTCRKRTADSLIFPVATNGASRTVSPQAKCLALPVKVRIEKFGFARFRNSGHTKNN